MAKPRRRTGHETIKASVSVDVALYARWGAAAALSGLNRGAFAVRALEEACRSVIVIDRRAKPIGPVKLNGSANPPALVDPDADDAA